MIVAVSDAHFGRPYGKLPEAERRRRFQQLLEELAPQAEALILLGDIFDFWFEWRWTIPGLYLDVLADIVQAARRTRVYFLPGNHDYWSGRLLARTGVIIRPQVEFSQNGHRILFTHGQDLLEMPLQSRWFQALITHPLSIWLYKLLHPDLGVALARWISSSSKTREILPIPQRIPERVHDLIRQGYHIVVTGHIHLPMIQPLSRGYYVCIGDWMIFFTYLVMDEKGIRLIRFEDRAVVAELPLKQEVPP